MNSKRRAELQRKLTLNAVPRPPVGLAERIKADIPQYLEPETGTQRLTRSLPFHMRIAASVIVLAGAVVVAMMVSQNREQEMASATATRPVIFAPAPRAMAPADTTTTVAAVARTEEVQLDIVQEAPIVVPEQIAAGRVAPPAMLSQPTFVEEVQRDAGGVEGEASYSYDVEDDVVGGTPAAPAVEPQRQMAENAPPVDAPAPAPPAEAVAPPPPASLAQTTGAFADAARLDRRQERTTSKIMAAEPREREAKKEDTFFGISVSAQAFHDIRTTLESGRRPAASAVNVEALVNYFAGAPARRPRVVSLEVEASPAVIPAEGEHAVLRFTIDTPAGSGVAASDARIDVVINDAVVADAQRLGESTADTDPFARQSVLPYGTSVTGLYALEMKPGLRSSQLVATVRLHYVINGKPGTITRLVHGHDLAKSWQRASRRHRLASLGALWAESLKGTAAGVDVARRAEELATQDPGDLRARELARAASASAAGGR
jgi:hypothetical protein